MPTNTTGMSSPITNIINTTSKTFGVSLCPQNGTFYTGDSKLNSTTSVNYLVSPARLGYEVTITGIKVGSVTVRLSRSDMNGVYGATLLDTNTPLIFLAKKPFAGFKVQLTLICETYRLPGVCNLPESRDLLSGYCFSLSAEEILMFPDLIFSLDGSDQPFTVTAQQYLIKQSNSSTPLYCMAIASSPQDESILGQIFFLSYSMNFDTTQKTIGFGPSSCKA